MGIGKRLDGNQVVQPKSDSSSAKDASAERFKTTKPSYTRDDLVLSDETSSCLLDFLAFKEHYDRVFDGWGLSETHKYHRQTSVNFYGPPGTGKTTAAHVVAHEMRKELILVSYAEIESKYVGETSKNLSALFDQANGSGAIIFFDEADAILSRRVTNMSSSTDVSVNQTRSVLLTLMDQHKGMVIFATNFMENYDPAFTRRIISHIHFTLPDNAARRQLWTKFIPRRMPVEVDVEKLAGASDGLSGAEISNCIIKSALSVSRRGKATVSTEDFIRSIDEILAGKAANAGRQIKTSALITRTERHVAEDYVRDRMGNTSVEELKK